MVQGYLNPRMQNHRGLTINYTWTFNHQEGQCPNPCTVQGSTIFTGRACFQSTSVPILLPQSSSATVSPCLGRILSPKTNSCQTPLSHPHLMGQKVISAMPSKYIKNPAMSYHLHCPHSGLGHHSFSLESL